MFIVAGAKEICKSPLVLFYALLQLAKSLSRTSCYLRSSRPIRPRFKARPDSAD